MLNAANRMLGSIAGNFDRPAGPVDSISEGVLSIFPILDAILIKPSAPGRALTVKPSARIG